MTPGEQEARMTVKVGVRGKLFLVSLALLVVSVAVSEIYLVPAVERDLTGRIEEDLHVRLELVAERAATLATAEGTHDWDALADRLGPAAQARVTLIRADGVVVGDSEVSRESLQKLDNHRTRPEVDSAFAGHSSDNIRYSTTIQKRMLYAAMAVPGGSGMVARLSLPLAWVDGAKARVRSLVLGGAAIALVAALLVSVVAAELMSRRLRSLTAVARRMAMGDLDARTRLESADELGELGSTLDHLAKNLSRSVQELRADRDLLGRILESMREGVLVMDVEHRILLANPSLRDLLLLDSDVVGRSTIEVIRNAELQRIIEKASAAREAVTGEIEIGGLKPRRLLVQAARLTGEPRALLLVLFDVTEMRRLETIRRDFVANVSHELRTPVASVRSAAETVRMAMSTDPKAADQFLEIIERNARRLGELIADLLDLSRLESNEFRLNLEPVDLAAAIDKSIAPFAERYAARHIEVKVDVERDCPSPMADKHGLDRVLSNLIDNALKYCPEGSTVVVSSGAIDGIRGMDGKVRIAVSDNGPGIEARHLPRLFERFYRIDYGRGRDLGGTGLGLSIVKHLVEAMKGEVSVTSTAGQGATFAFTLPAARS
jgi:two-component system, OmpR family, phosphate regulon sensor histidine kinase PhoR